MSCEGVKSVIILKLGTYKKCHKRVLKVLMTMKLPGCSCASAILHEKRLKNIVVNAKDIK